VLLYTPPYCPRANAVESIFKEMTDYCRRHREATKRDPPAAMTAGLLAVTPEKAATFVWKSGEKHVAGLCCVRKYTSILILGTPPPATLNSQLSTAAAPQQQAAAGTEAFGWD
jgi:hypothetical protein